MATPFYAGLLDQNTVLGDGVPRYFYAMRRDSSGNLYFTRLDQLTSQDLVTVNKAGVAANNFANFEWGVDFLDGRLDTDHTRPNPNLNFDQWRWDNRSVYYYVNTQGQLVARINQTYNYTS
jgi:hypothetical protein